VGVAALLVATRIGGIQDQIVDGVTGLLVDDPRDPVEESDQFVRAIRERPVYIIDRDTISRCGPRLVDALEEIVDVLYGEPAAAGESGSEL
jgi:glycosyltransferase involved in cell wall biosynthesis